MKEKIRSQIYTLLRETLDDDSVEIQDDCDILNDLELSSLELSEMLSEIEEEYNIRITTAMLRKIIFVGDIIDVVMSCVGKP